MQTSRLYHQLQTLLGQSIPQQVVATGKRRLVDAHWQRGNSYLRIGWNWFKGTVHQGWRLFSTISLRGEADPDPAIASKKQSQQQLDREFTIQSYIFVS